MKFTYQFSNLCGTVYKEGNVLFTADGNTLISPVGNRVTLFDLVNHKSSTLPVETRKNIAQIALSPNGLLLLLVDVDGVAVFVNFLRRVVVCEFTFRAPVTCAMFTPDSKYLAVGQGREVHIWRSPPLVTQYRPMALHRTLTGPYADVTSIDFTPDSRFLAVGSEDHSVRLYSIDPVPGFQPLTLTGHRNTAVGCFFARASPFEAPLQPGETPSPLPKKLYSVGKDGSLFVWEYLPFDPKGEEGEGEGEGEGGKGDKDNKKRKTHKFHEQRKSKRDEESEFSKSSYVLVSKHYFDQDHAQVMCCALHRGTNGDLLVVGFTSGVFGLYELPMFVNIHTLSISQKRITSVAINQSGDWLAFGSRQLGQLLVWEWKSETYVLKQQGHFFDVNTLSFSPDGQVVATGGDDGKVKLWNTTTGFCFVTFSEHTGPVTAVEMSATGTVVFSASTDGSIRAFDLVRYRNFRNMRPAKPAQLTCLAIDPSGELVVAGSFDPFEIYVFALQTGKVVDVLAGHEGPVSGVAFSSAQSLLASSSWDKTVRLWDVYAGKGCVETLQHSCELVTVAYRPDGKELCASGLDGQLYFWDPAEGQLLGTIEGRKDIMGGRRRDDARQSNNATHSTCFTSVCYSADGECVLAGGNSKFVCIYLVKQKLLLRKFAVSNNLSLDGVQNFLNSRKMTTAGNVDDLDADESGSDLEDRLDRSLPGAKKGDHSNRKTPLVARTKCVRFSPTGLQWAAASTEGLILYSLDDSLVFDPSELELEVTPEKVEEAIDRKHFAKALVMALSLNESKLIKQVVESCPEQEVSLVVQSIPLHRLPRVVSFLGTELESTAHVHFYLLWAQALLTLHGPYLKPNATKLMTSFRALHKAIMQHRNDLAPLCNENQYLLQFLTSCRGHAQAASSASITVEEEEEGAGASSEGADEGEDVDE